jgi:hypothetical protein
MFDKHLTPAVLEAIRRQLGVAHRVLDVLKPEVGLQRPGVIIATRNLESAG